MKLLTNVFIFFIFITSIALPQNLKITQYNLNLELFPSQNKMNAESIVKIKSLDSNSVNTLKFSLSYYKINSVSDLHGNKYNFKKDGDKLIVNLNKPIKQNDSLSIRINYQSKFYDYWTSKSIMLIEELEFYPQLENKNFDEKAIFNTKITVPDGLTAVSCGNLISVDTLKDKLTYHYKTNDPVTLFSVCAGVYSVHEQTVDNIRIESFLSPEHKDEADTLINHAGKILSYYQKQFGKVLLTDYKIVEVVTPSNGISGYSPKGMVCLSSDWINEDDYLSLFIFAHEIAHQWFPNKIMFNYNDWYLNESFAQYAANSYFRNILNINDKKVNLSKKFLFLSLGTEGNFGNLFRIIFGSTYEEKPVSEIKYGDNLYNWAGYYKGYYFLNSLAFTMGINTFNNAIKKLIESGKKDVISQEYYIKYLEKISGKDLSSQVNDWVNTNKIIDYDICNVRSEKTTAGNYKTTVQIKNNGNMSFPFQVMAVTSNNKKLIKRVDSLQNGINYFEFLSDDKVVKAEIDPDWYGLDANRINNYYPRQSKFSFLISDLNLSEEQYFYYPSFTYSKRDNFRLGLWLSNIYPIMSEAFSRNLELIKWRAGLFYGFRTKRAGYFIDFRTLLGMPSYRWNWGMNLYNYRGTENYDLSLKYVFQKNQRNSKYNILTLSTNRNLIYDIEYYDNRDFETGTNNTLTLSWNRKIYSEKENITAKFGGKLMGGNFSYSKISIELENFLPFSIDWLSYRLFGGIVRGNYPSQESVFLSGGVYPSSFAYWFVDPSNSISTQENLHIKGDANLRGFIGQHLRGKNGFGLNLEIPFPKYSFINLFFDLGNVWDKSFGILKYDAGIGLDFKFLKIDFPFYVNEPSKDEEALEFRWLLEFSF